MLLPSRGERSSLVVTRLRQRPARDGAEGADRAGARNDYGPRGGHREYRPCSGHSEYRYGTVTAP
jgi:hypothetical protein